MLSPNAERALSEALEYGNALLKFISPNNVGETGSHECGYYLPIGAWQMYTPHPPQDGENNEHPVTILWQDGRTTDSRIKWYGKGTRHEYRLTRFGRDFPFLTAGNIGDLLVLIRTSEDSFHGYVLDLEEDIDGLQEALAVDIVSSWGIYDPSRAEPLLETEDDRILSQFRCFAGAVDEFPSTSILSGKTQEALLSCIPTFKSSATDQQLVRLVASEYSLFKMVERKLCTPEVARLFKSVDDFLATALKIMNRRKARAGRALENHFGYILKEVSIPFDVRPRIAGVPDIVIPSQDAYEDGSYPEDKLLVVGVKTTCKDRWRQVLQEGKRVRQKHLLTMQQGISSAQLKEMREANVRLVVPKPLHNLYPKDERDALLSVDDFVREAKARIA